MDIDYYQFDVETAKYYTSERPRPNSPFLSLIELSDHVKGAYCRPHSVLLDGYPHKDGTGKIPAKKINRPLALMVLHGGNVSNKIVGHEVSRG